MSAVGQKCCLLCQHPKCQVMHDGNRKCAQVRVNYNEAEFLKATMKASKEDKPKGPRLTKMPQLNDFQFFNTKRIEELYAIEHAHETWKFQQNHRRLELEKAGTTPEEIEAQLNKCAVVQCLSAALICLQSCCMLHASCILLSSHINDFIASRSCIWVFQLARNVMDHMSQCAELCVGPTSWNISVDVDNFAVLQGGRLRAAADRGRACGARHPAEREPVQGLDAPRLQRVHSRVREARAEQHRCDCEGGRLQERGGGAHMLCPAEQHIPTHTVCPWLCTYSIACMSACLRDAEIALVAVTSCN